MAYYIDFEENDRLDGRIKWTSTTNTADNSSTITAILQCRKVNATVATSGTWKYSFTVGTEKISGSYVGDISTEWVDLKTISTTKAHNSDGTGSCYIYGKITAPTGTSMEGLSVSNSETVTLDTIARKATITSAEDFTDEGAPSMRYSNPLGSDATIDVGIYWDSSTALIPYETVTGASGAKTFTLTNEQKQAIYTKLSDKTEETIYYYIRTTLSDDTKYYHKLAKTVSIVNAEPTFTGLIIPDAKTQTLTGTTDRWIKGYTDLLVGFDEVELKKGATAKQYLAICGTKKLYGNQGLDSSGLPVAVLEDINANIAGLYLTDSRGNGAAMAVEATLIDYIDLTCNIKVSMTLETNSEGVSTSKATITVSGNAYGGAFKADGANNTIILKYRSKAEDAEAFGDWVTVETKPTINSSNKYSATITVTGLDYQKVHSFQVGALDDLRATFELGEKVSNTVADKAIPVFDWSAEDFNFNVPVTINGLEFQKLINALTASTKLTVSTSAGSGYSDLSCEAYLIGNMIRFSFGATRSAAVTGNIENEKVMTITVEHEGKIQSSFNTSFSTGATGAVSALYTNNMAKTKDANGNETGTGFSFDIILAATATASLGFGGFFYMPVTLNLNNF